ncbi:MAG TPA: trigger factor, partial [Armatimonadota bacterium]
RVNQHMLEQEAIEAVIDITYKEALTEQNLEPLERGEIEDLNAADDKTLTYTVLVSVRPEIKLPTYTGLKVTQHATQISDEQVAAEIERLRERTADFSEVDDGIQTGDYVTIDYAMTVDGEAYPDGDTTGYPLEVGTDTFFPELNEGLLGVKQGETTTVTTTYPTDYSNKDLAGKTASFEITIQQVRRMIKPDASDAWAETISQGALTTIDTLRERLKENLQAMASQSDHDQVRNELVRQVVEQAELDLPETLVDEEFSHLMEELEQKLTQQRMTLAEYAEAVTRTEDDIKNEQMLLARDMVRRSLVLQEVARCEKIYVTDEDVDAALLSFAQGGRSLKDIRKDLEKSGRLNSIASRIFHEKVLGFLEAQAEITVEGQPTDAETTEAPAADTDTPDATE